MPGAFFDFVVGDGRAVIGVDSCSASACRFQSALIDGIVGLSHGPETKAQGLGAAQASASSSSHAVKSRRGLSKRRSFSHSGIRSLGVEVLDSFCKWNSRLDSNYLGRDIRKLPLFNGRDTDRGRHSTLPWRRYVTCQPWSTPVSQAPFMTVPFLLAACFKVQVPRCLSPE